MASQSTSKGYTGGYFLKLGLQKLLMLDNVTFLAVPVPLSALHSLGHLGKQLSLQEVLQFYCTLASLSRSSFHRRMTVSSGHPGMFLKASSSCPCSIIPFMELCTKVSLGLCFPENSTSGAGPGLRQGLLPWLAGCPEVSGVARSDDL